MNKLILIGNGFDLAHGLKTGYGDFLLNYFQNIIGITIGKSKREYSDELCTVHFGNLVNVEKALREIHDCPDLKSFQDLNFIHIVADADYPLKSNRWKGGEIIIRMKYRFFHNMIIDRNWTNIEQYYFNELLKTFNERMESISDINRIFQILITKLNNYLLTINKPIKEQLVGPLSPVMDRIKELSNQGEKALFINFNYTQLLAQYLRYDFRDFAHELIHIHGNLGNQGNIIFGYGDDSNEHYPKLENSLNDSYMEYIKSFNYPAEKNYEKLNEFVESDMFEVIVIGHSLGVSDRVLLKTIFENKNCYKIRLFHRGSVENHKKKYISLSRHFSDKVSMRKKIISFDKEDVI